MPRPSLRQHAVAAAVMLCGWLWFFLPSGWGKLRDSVTPDLGDPLFNLAIMRWGAQRLPDLEAFWNAPFFHPSANAVLRSDHLLGPAVWMKLTEPLAGPVFAYNLLFLLSFVLSGFATYWVLSHRFSWTAALLGGFWWAYAPYRMAGLNHLQMLLAQWLPLLLWHFDRLLVRPTSRRAALFLGFYALHITGGAYLAMMVHCVLAVLILNRWREIREGLRKRKSLLIWATVALVGLVALFWTYGPYLKSEVTAERRLEELRDHSTATIDYLTPHRRYRWSDLWPAAWPERTGRTLFPGFLALALGILGVRSLVTRARAAIPADPWTRLGLVLAGVSAIAALALADLQTLAPSLGASENLARAYLLSFLLATLSVALLLAAARSRRQWPLKMRERDRWARGWLWMGVVAASLSVPSLYVHSIGWLPGFDSIRAISRFHVFVAVALALAVAAGVDVVVRKSEWRRAVLWTGLAAMGLALYPVEVEWRPIGSSLDDLPELYRVLAERSDATAFVEFPIPENSGGEALRMYYQTFHRTPMVNGHSASVSEQYQTVRRLCHGPLPQDPQCYDYLRSLGVNYVLTTPEALHRNVRRNLRLAEERLPLEAVHRGPRSTLFRLKEASGPAPP